MSRTRGLDIPALALPFTHATARGPLSVDLKFTPMTATGSAAPELDSAALSRSIAVRVRDERPGDPAIVGEGTDDDDSTFEVRSNRPFGPFAAEVGLRGELQAADGRTLLRGVALGDTRR